MKCLSLRGTIIKDDKEAVIPVPIAMRVHLRCHSASDSLALQVLSQIDRLFAERILVDAQQLLCEVVEE